MRAALHRLVIPVILLGAYIGASEAADRFDNDEVTELGTEVDASSTDTPVFSIRRAPEMLTSQRAADELTRDLDSWVASLPSSSCFVVSAGGETLYSHQADLPLAPASNMKLLTAVAALQVLGADHTYETRIEAEQPPDANGFLLGNLYVIGGGDPLLMTDAYRATLDPDLSDIHSSADTLADQAVAANLSDVSGAVLVDETRYDTERVPAGVTQDLIDAGLIGSLGAATLDRGYVGFKDGYSSQIDPDSGSAGEGTDAETDETEQTQFVPPPLPRAAEPADEFAANFDDLLEALNVRIARRAAKSTETPETLTNLATFHSPPLSKIVEQMLTNSDNTTAEMLIKELGFAFSEAGSTTAGTLAMSTVLRGANIDDTGLFALDGSGLSAGNTATCAVLHDALNSGHKDVLRAALPIAGETGTLAEDFLGTKGEGRIRAKTGLLARASALSGYFVTDPGVELTFSLIINVGEEETINSDQVAGWQRPLPRILASYPEGPALEDLGPIGIAPTGG